MSALELSIPSLDEQRDVVAEIEKQFSRLDEAVAGLQRVKANLKRYKAAVLKSAVTGRLVSTEADLARREGRSYESGAQLLHRILETRRSQWQGKGKYKEPAAPDTTDLPELPEGWVWATMPQLGELARGKSKHRPRDDAKLYGGPYPNLIVAGRVAAVAGEKAQHIRNRGFDSQYYRDLIVALVREHHPVSREDIDKLLLDKLPEVLTQEQKFSKVHNLLSSLSGKVIRNAGTRSASRWILIEHGKQ